MQTLWVLKLFYGKRDCLFLRGGRSGCDQRYSLRYSSGDGVVGDLFHHGDFDDVYDGHMVCREGAMTCHDFSEINGYIEEHNCQIR